MAKRPTKVTRTSGASRARAATRKGAAGTRRTRTPARKTAAAARRASPEPAAKRTVRTTRKASAPARAPAKPAPRRAIGTARKAATRTRAPKVARAIVLAAPTRDDPHWVDTLSDGTHVIIRPIHKEDAALERAFIRRLSPESRRMRFLGQMSDPSEEVLEALTDIDYRRDMAFVALVHRDGEKREIGVARYGTSEDGTTCECAVTVADDWHNRGLGTILMRHLIEVARERGIRTMISIDAADNNAMRDLARFLGFKRKADPADPSQVVHTLALD